MRIDGVGRALVQLAWLAGSLAAARAEAAPNVRLLDARMFVGGHTSDYSTLTGGTDSFVGARSSLGATLSSPLQLRLDALVGRFGAGTITGAGALRLYSQTPRFLWGTSYGYAALEGGIETHSVMLHGELYEGSLLTATSSVGYESKNFGPNLVFAELFLRLYPTHNMLLAAGVSYAVADVKQTRGDVVLRAEWVPLRCLGVQSGFFAQYGGNLFTRAMAGLIVYFDQLSYAERERRDGLFMARFD